MMVEMPQVKLLKPGGFESGSAPQPPPNGEHFSKMLGELSSRAKPSTRRMEVSERQSREEDEPEEKPDEKDAEASRSSAQMTALAASMQPSPQKPISNDVKPTPDGTKSGTEEKKVEGAGQTGETPFALPSSAGDKIGPNGATDATVSGDKAKLPIGKESDSPSNGADTAAVKTAGEQNPGAVQPGTPDAVSNASLSGTLPLFGKILGAGGQDESQESSAFSGKAGSGEKGHSKTDREEKNAGGMDILQSLFDGLQPSPKEADPSHLPGDLKLPDMTQAAPQTPPQLQPNPTSEAASSLIAQKGSILAATILDASPDGKSAQSKSESKPITSKGVESSSLLSMSNAPPTFALTSPSPVQDAPPIAPAPFVEQVAHQLQYHVKEGRSEMVLRLDPTELGQLQVHLTSEGGVVTARFHSDSAEVRSMLESHLPALQTALSDAGVQVQQFSVSAGSDFSQSNQQPSEQPQPPQGRPSSRSSNTIGGMGAILPTRSSVSSPGAVDYFA